MINEQPIYYLALTPTQMQNLGPVITQDVGLYVAWLIALFFGDTKKALEALEDYLAFQAGLEILQGGTE